ncbi:U-box-domain-containing protein [Piromyces finnis]|uniref:E3 ubiquitin-protein ligase CHIP n=1 Tax=Piromyces finnis TaxID=1754191 RepID=A0A1Y1VL59_9FUNG|nr:U-box-domain-containing protein [Piromyces finnis]|eukprot:ORX58636.1 U-box-domain-containing protein [Piromyces finnis]
MDYMHQEAEKHKLQGNIFFKREQYEEAIKEYTTAIIKDSGNIVYFTNRALCYIRLKKFEEAINDCQKAIEIDKFSLKGNYLLGQAITESSNSPARLAEAIQVLKIAYDQSIKQGKDSNEIGKAILKARNKKYEVESSRKVFENCDLMDYLTNLMEQDRKRQIEKIQSDSSKSEEDIKNEIEYINYDQNQKLKTLKNTFSKADPFQKDREEPPDFLYGKIHFNIMNDPVITPSGITYDRSELLEHFDKIGHFDPLTRKEITEKDLIPNRALKEAIEDFLNYNGWAIDS